MILGKWNKSVIVTYIGIFSAVFGVVLAFMSELRFAISCLIISGICDLIDGPIARRVNRTDDEKEFGVELDSLADVIAFIALPILISLKAGLKHPLFAILYAFFAIAGIARLAFFNISTANKDTAVSYYQGLPVTYTALILPFVLLLKYVLRDDIFIIVYAISIFVVALLNILNFKCKKPRGTAYVLFPLIAIIMLVLYLGVLW